MKLSVLSVLLAAALAAPALAQTTPASPDPQRDATRESLRATLAEGGARGDVDMAFHQSQKNPYNFSALATGLRNSDSLEVVVSATKADTITFRIYPHYHGAYINTRRVHDPTGLKDQLLHFSDQNFLFWGADDTNDVFCGYSITLESGFPREAVIEVLRSIRNTDGFVGQMRPLIDGTAAR